MMMLLRSWGVKRPSPYIPVHGVTTILAEGVKVVAVHSVSIRGRGCGGRDMMACSWRTFPRRRPPPSPPLCARPGMFFLPNAFLLI